MNATPALQVPAKPRLYRRILTSTLHTRFIHAAALSLILSWDNAVFLHPKRGSSCPQANSRDAHLTQVDLIWSWFPAGPAGFKAALFFLTNLFVFTLLIATTEVGRPSYRSFFTQLRSVLLSKNAVYVTAGYLASASWFAEAYIWSSSDLTWITKGNMTTADKLNERPIYLRSFFMMLGLVQAVQHLYLGRSSLHIPIAPPPTPQATDRRTHHILDSFTQIKAEVPWVLGRSALISAIAAALGPFVYSLFLRQSMWQAHLYLAKPWFNLSRSNARATGFPPLLGILLPSIIAGFFLNVTCEMTTILFLVSFRKPPTNKDIPLSSTSKDPNATLLTGLKARKGFTKTFAFWELALIAQNFPDRRKAIFSDIDRPSGPIWSSMLSEALKVLQSIDARIAPPAPVISSTAQQQSSVQTLPKLLAEAPSNNVLVSAPRSSSARRQAEDMVSSGVRNLGSSPKPWRPAYDKAARTIEEKSGAAASPIERLLASVKKGSLSSLFSVSNAAKIDAAVLGSPIANAAVVVDATEAMTRMLVASLQEDPYGKAIAGVPSAVKQFSNTINLIDQMFQASPADRGIEEVQIVLARLKADLAELLSAFQTFLLDTGLGIGELNTANKASGQKTIDRAPEPKQIEKAPTREALPEPTHPQEQDEGWRSWGRQRNAENTRPLFPNRTERRKEPRVVHVPRRREMEQVR